LIIEAILPNGATAKVLEVDIEISGYDSIL